ncbi:DUF6069 family protein [Spirillospora sp. NPDC047279]|uniref:DUF6069 family protein n=1 Tax=Spirillospora sp. NPDC047279 TaxID=3155478 RepID=UPI0034066856
MTGPSFDRNPQPYEPRPQRPAPTSHVDSGVLWGGGLATAAVATLVAFAGVLIARGVFGVELLAPERAGSIGDSTTGAYLVLAGSGALVAALILQILVALTPRPLAFFSWILGMLTVIFAVMPLTADAPASTRVATSLINLFIGLAITSLLRQIGAIALRSGGHVSR